MMMMISLDIFAFCLSLYFSTYFIRFLKIKQIVNGIFAYIQASVIWKKSVFTNGLSGPSINRKVSYTLLVMIRKRFSLQQTIIKDITLGLVRMYVTPYRFSWTIFILGLALSYTANCWYSDGYKLCSTCS